MDPLMNQYLFSKNDENLCNGGSGTTGYTRPLNLKKFKVPSRVSPKEQAPSVAMVQSGQTKEILGNHCSLSGSFGKRPGYTIDDDELDDIWGTEGSKTYVQKQHYSDATENEENLHQSLSLKRRRDIWNDYPYTEETPASDSHRQDDDGYKYDHHFELASSQQCGNERGCLSSQEYDDNYFGVKTESCDEGIRNDLSEPTFERLHSSRPTTASLANDKGGKVNIWGDSDSD